ncbi:MAG: acyl carrier protein [Thermoguttaceae bacterium]|jgi:acyl carrier protein
MKTLFWFILGGLVFFVIDQFLVHRALKTFLSRTCTGRDWKRRFPDATKDEIRRFLSIFINAFGFKSRQILKFHPDDKITDIYRALYPLPFSADSLELVTLTMNVQKEYGLDLIEHFNQEMTLGQLFQLIKNIVKNGG